MGEKGVKRKWHLVKRGLEFWIISEKEGVMTPTGVHT